MSPGEQELGCRVASAGCPAEDLTRSGQGDFHHPALPATRLAAFRYLPELRGHAIQHQRIGHVSFRKFVSPPAAFSRPASGAPRFPASALVCSPPTPLPALAGAPVSLAVGLPL